MNKVVLSGNLTKNPDIRYSKGDQTMTIARYTLAVNRRGRRDEGGDQPTADFISCVAFRQQAEFAEKYLRKGMKIAVTGHIQTGSYTNRDGQKVYTTDVVVEDHEFCESKNANSSSGGYTAPTAPAPESAAGDGFMSIPDDLDDVDLPFN